MQSSCHYSALQYDTLKDKRIVVAVDGWEPDSMYPSGHYTRTLGTIGDRETETEVRGLYTNGRLHATCRKFSPCTCHHSLCCDRGPLTVAGC